MAEMLTGYGLLVLLAIVVVLAVLFYFWLAGKFPALMKSKVAMELMALFVDMAISATEEWKYYQDKVKGKKIDPDEATKYAMVALRLLAKRAGIKIDDEQAEVMIRSGLLHFNGQKIAEATKSKVTKLR